MKQAMYLILSTLLLQAVFFAGPCDGFDNGHLQKLNSTNKCQSCDLSKANLSNLDMYGADLAGVNLTGADLSNASFLDANLTGADLTNANVKGANFAGAKLSNATWIDGRKCKSPSIGTCK